MKEQQKQLLQEYERLGRPLDSQTLEEIVSAVDRKLSANQTFVVKSDSGQKGPLGETQFLSNLKTSAWLPKSGEWAEEVYFDENNAPFVCDRKANQSHYCIDLMKRLVDQQQSQSQSQQANVPLPGQNANPSLPATVPTPTTTTGSVPLPGMKAANTSHLPGNGPSVTHAI